jgi:hypothetical protein
MRNTQSSDSIVVHTRIEAQPGQSVVFRIEIVGSDCPPSAFRDKPQKVDQKNYSVEEVAIKLGRKPATVKGWIRKGDLRAIKVERPGGMGTDLVITEKDLERYQKNRKCTGRKGHRIKIE